MRELFGNTASFEARHQVWPMEHSVLASLLWSLAIVAIALPLAMKAFGRER